MENFDYKKHTLGRELEEVSLDIDGEVLRLKLRKLPWSKRNQLISSHLRWDSDQKTFFDGDGYVRECLKYMIVEAPWGQTTDLFLSGVDDVLGAALETLVPKAFSSSISKIESVGEIKKE